MNRKKLLLICFIRAYCDTWNGKNFYKTPHFESMKNKYEDLKRKPRKTILQSLNFSSISLRFVFSFEQMNVIVFKLSRSTLEQYSSLQPPLPPPPWRISMHQLCQRKQRQRDIFIRDLHKRVYTYYSVLV